MARTEKLKQEQNLKFSFDFIYLQDNLTPKSGVTLKKWNQSVTSFATNLEKKKLKRD